LCFLDTHSGAVTALATVIIALFTVVLSMVTGRQAEITKEALVNVERAFVFVKIIHATAVKDPHSKKITQWLFSAEWVNSGSTPTKDMRTCTNMIKVEGDVRILDQYEFIDPPGLQQTPTIVGPQSSILTGGVYITLDDALHMVARNQRQFIYGWADYNDVFSGTPRHRTEFCNEITFLGDPRRDDCKIDTPHFKRFNGADGECFRKPGKAL
jgi:hypothetical protein